MRPRGGCCGCPVCVPLLGAQHLHVHVLVARVPMPARTKETHAEGGGGICQHIAARLRHTPHTRYRDASALTWFASSRVGTRIMQRGGRPILALVARFSCRGRGGAEGARGGEGLAGERGKRPSSTQGNGVETNTCRAALLPPPTQPGALGAMRPGLHAPAHPPARPSAPRPATR